MRHAIAASMIVVSALLPLTAQERTHQRIDVSKLGPQVGSRVPDFSLVDQSGRRRDLRSLMGRRGAMLVFIRSADW